MRNVTVKYTIIPRFVNDFSAKNSVFLEKESPLPVRRLAFRTLSWYIIPILYIISKTGGCR